MCGICGIACSDDRPVERKLLDQMTDILQHRGPDSRGVHIAPGIGLGVRRLSIIDIQGGDQPISNEDGSLTLVCNGEIYNYVELRAALETSGHRFRTSTDVETILHLYEDHGIDCVKRLRGMFTFALWDKRNRLLFLARDRFGIKPLFYHLGSREITFGVVLLRPTNRG
jgi:asparagine synthase (glutamine-hydrolysing)